jgi:hypothetical protein
MKPPGKPQEPVEETEQLDLLKPDMLEHINTLHAEKHAAYGDSWKRRGEIGILANIARKVDRIGTGLATRDEAQSDTAQDLLVYLGKMLVWLKGGEGDPEEVAKVFSNLTGWREAPSFDSDLDELFNIPSGPSREKIALIEKMMNQAYTYALSLW